MIVAGEPPCAAPALASLVPFLYEFLPAQAGLVVIAAFVRSLRQLDLVTRDLLVRNRLEDMRDDVQPGAPLVVGADQTPGRVLGVGRIEHQIARPRVIVPAAERLGVHRAQLPLPQWILDARLEAGFLLAHPDL